MLVPVLVPVPVPGPVPVHVSERPDDPGSCWCCEGARLLGMAKGPEEDAEKMQREIVTDGLTVRDR